MILGLAAGLLAAALFGAAAVVQAAAARRTPGLDGLGTFVAHAVRDPVMLAVVGAYLGGFVLHAVSIWLLPLYLAQAAISLSMPVTALVARRRLREPLGVVDWAGVGAVSAGLVLLGLGSGAAGEPRATALFAVLVWGTAVGVTVLALGTRGWPAGWLGTLAGVGYAGSAIAVRGVNTPVDLPVLCSAAAVPLLGVVAFWVYSMAMGRATVVGATGPLIVTQTVVPAAIGVAALGDEVRSWPLTVLGLLLSTGAAVLLSRGATEGEPAASELPSGR